MIAYLPAVVTAIWAVFVQAFGGTLDIGWMALLTVAAVLHATHLWRRYR